VLDGVCMVRTGLLEEFLEVVCRRPRLALVAACCGHDESVVGLNPPTGVDRQHESQEARSLYLSALQLTRALRLEFVGRAT
jgi:hypothetical protein